MTGKLALPGRIVNRIDDEIALRYIIRVFSFNIYRELLRLENI